MSAPDKTPPPQTEPPAPAALESAQPVVSEGPPGAPIQAPSKSDADEVISRLAALSPFDYDRVRREKAKALSIQVKTLDEMVKKARNEDTNHQRLPFPEVEPHPEPVNPAELFDEIASIIRGYIVLANAQVDALTLWIVMTWLIDVVEVAPIAIITAPEKACGKSQLLQVLGYLVALPLSAASFTASFLFRAIQAWRPTILIDEADTFIRDNDELKGLVNAGHTRANAFVGRTVAVGDGHEPKLFDVWGAKAFAGIALERHLPDATMSRGIVIVLRRKRSDETVSRLRHADRQIFSRTASKLARFSDDYSGQVRVARPQLPDELSDRAQDNWEPLLAIAECAGPAWVKRAIDAALMLSGAAEESTSIGNQLLSDIRDTFGKRAVSKISTMDLIEALTAYVEKPWATYNKGRPLSPRQLARHLAAYDIRPKTVRQTDGTPKGYDAAQFEDAFARYLAATPALPQRRNESKKPIGVMAAGVADDPLDIRNVPTPLEPITDLDCGGVADESQGSDEDSAAGSEAAF